MNIFVIIFGLLMIFSIGLGGYASFVGIIDGIASTFDDDVHHKVYYGKKEPAKVSWFFGPCMMVFPAIFQHAFRQIVRQVRQINRIWKRLMRGFFLKKLIFGPLGAILIAYQWPVGAVLALFWATVFSVMFLAFLIVFYLLFIPFFIIDRIYLFLRGYKNHCPNCNESSIIPQVACPECGAVHKHLAPNKYGIFNHQCTCGCILGSTYLTGKGKLHTICPHCGEPLNSGATVPFTLQLVGGTSSGKTVFVAAMMDQIHKAASKSKIRITPVPSSQANLAELDQFVKRISDPMATEGRDVTFYSEIFEMGGGKAPIKLEVVDIPGEMFSGEVALQEGIHKMSQYKYANGFIFLVDPFADGDLLRQAPRDGTSVSPISPSEVLDNFDQYLIAQKFAKTDQLITKPISIVVAKSDTEAVSKLLTIEMIKEEFEANKASYGNNFDRCRDEMVKQFLISISQADLVSKVEARFKNAHFFLSSAMGHAPNNDKQYAPVQVIETVDWIMSQTKPALYKRLFSTK